MRLSQGSNQIRDNVALSLIVDKAISSGETFLITSQVVKETGKSLQD